MTRRLLVAILLASAGCAPSIASRIEFPVARGVVGLDLALPPSDEPPVTRRLCAGKPRFCLPEETTAEYRDGLPPEISHIRVTRVASRGFTAVRVQYGPGSSREDVEAWITARLGPPHSRSQLGNPEWRDKRSIVWLMGGAGTPLLVQIATRPGGGFRPTDREAIQGWRECTHIDRDFCPGPDTLSAPPARAP